MKQIKPNASQNVVVGGVDPINFWPAFLFPIYMYINCT